MNNKLYFRVFTVKGKLSDIIKWFKIMRELEELEKRYCNEDK